MPLPEFWESKFDVCTLDFETRFSDEYTLKKLNLSSYVRDPRFKAHMVAIKWNDEQTDLVLHKDIPKALKLRGKRKWSTTMLNCHNTAFDGLVLSHHYGVIPAVYLCTLSMARGLHGNAIKADLDTVARFYKLGNKMEDVLIQSKGIDNLELPEHRDILLKMGAYCCVDADLSLAVLDKMTPLLPAVEFELIHQTINMFANPVLMLDTKLATQARDEEIVRRRELFAKIVLPEEIEEARGSKEFLKSLSAKKKALMDDFELAQKLIRNNNFYTRLLEEFGVKPPMKFSGAKGKMVPSFARSGLEDLQNSIMPDADDPTAADELYDLLQARIDANSTIAISRAERLLKLGENKLPMPIGYNYYRAHTGRWGGANKTNFQNFGRGSKLRRAIRAQRGYVLPVLDSSQIEARVLSWMADAKWKLSMFREYDKIVSAQFEDGTERKARGDAVDFMASCLCNPKFKEFRRAGPDGYRVAATGIYKKSVDQITKDERQIGKVSELALGYQGSVGAFNSMARNYGVRLPENKVQSIVRAWRKQNIEIVRFWGRCEEVLADLVAKRKGSFGPGGILKYGVLNGTPQIILPNGMTLKYPGLHVEVAINEWGKERRAYEYLTAEGPKSIYGGLMTENITQALARIVVAEQCLPVARKWRWVMTTHDEGVFHVPTIQAKPMFREALREFCRPPAWAPDLPVSGDGGFDVCYSK